MHVIKIRMYRGNLRCEVVHAVGAEEKRSLVHKLVDEIEGPGTVYATTVKTAQGCTRVSTRWLRRSITGRSGTNGEIGNVVELPCFGKGVIQAVKGDQITAAFPTAKRNSSCQATC